MDFSKRKNAFPSYLIFLSMLLFLCSCAGSSAFKRGKKLETLKNYDEALKFIDQSIKIKQTFRNLSTKANVLWAMGKKEAAFTVADAAIAKGKADKVDTANFEKRVADMKSGKM